MESITPIMVSISCITYNHAPYIRQCLDGFIMQKTSFAFEVLIHDDCSTDGTTEIIKEYETKYPDIIKPLYEIENQYQQGKPSGSAVWNFPRAKGKYIAICEGDDYWIDPYKLQKQVDFLEANPEYSLVFTDFQYVNAAGEVINTPQSSLYMDLKYRLKEGFIWHHYITNAGFILTCTVLYRVAFYSDEDVCIDHGLYMSLSRRGPVKYLDIITSSYRYLQSGMMRSSADIVDVKVKNAIFNQLYYYKRYPTHEYYLGNREVVNTFIYGVYKSIRYFSQIIAKNKYRKLFAMICDIHLLYRTPFVLYKVFYKKYAKRKSIGN